MARCFTNLCWLVLLGWTVAQFSMPLTAQEAGDDQPPPAAEQPVEPPAEPSDQPPAEPQPDQPTPETPMPADPAPVDPAPADPAPAPTDPAPVDPAPADPAPADPAPADPAPADPAPADPAAEKPAPEAPDGSAPAAEMGEARQAFDEALGQWKDLLKELRQLRADFRSADPAELAEIRQRWNEAMARGEQLIDQLRVTGQAAYAADPKDGSELVDFLVSLVVDAANRDDYEPAAEVARTLLDHGCERPDLYRPAGMAMLAVNEFTKAQEVLNKARDAGTLDAVGMKYLADLPEYVKFWEIEKGLREQEAEADDLPRVRMTTNRGEIVIELLENEAPETVGNFISLVSNRFYDGLTFHRVLPAFMAQGGCPTGDGTGGPDYRIYCESGKENHRKHFRGSLSMAHAGKNTGGSQFFLTFLPTPHLNGAHTVFGRVVEGMDVLAKLQRIDPSEDKDKGLEPDRIIKAEVIRKRDHEYQPRKVE
jgi:cyclophilin family peptidyl-prolyl cis-trans isomerase